MQRQNVFSVPGSPTKTLVRRLYSIGMLDPLMLFARRTWRQTLTEGLLVRDFT
jgi:hypothetical protein